MPPAIQTSRPPDSGTILFRRGVVVLLVTVFAGLLLFRAGGIWWRYEEVVRGGHEQAGKFAHVLSEHLQQTFATIDATFAHLVDFSTQVGGPEAADKDWHKVLEASLSGLKAVDRISVLDRNGTVRHSTRSRIVGEQRADHPVFRMLAGSPDVGLVTQGSFRDPDTSRLSLPIARVLTSRSGEFSGIVSALFDPQLLDDFYRDIDFGERSVISIVTLDGEVMYRHGSAGSLSALTAAARGMSPGAAQSGNGGVLALRAPLDPGGEPYFTALRPLNNLPLAIAVSLSEAEALRSWQQELNLSIIVLGTVALLLMIGGGLMARELHARSAADSALKRNEAHFHEIMYRAPILVSVKDAKGRVKFINKALEERDRQAAEGHPFGAHRPGRDDRLARPGGHRQQGIGAA